MLLLAVALAGIALAGVGHLWSTHAKREREATLLGVGAEIRRALESYAEASAGLRVAAQPYPVSLEALLEDNRGPARRRHLRRIYFDPVTGSPEWGLIRNAQGGVIGVFSRAAGVPLKQAGFDAIAYAGFENARSYGDWKFVANGAQALATDPARRADGVPTPASVDARGNDAKAGATATEASQPAIAAAQVPVEPPTPRVPTPQDYRERSPEACARIRTYEDYRCRSELDGPNDAELRAACLASIAARSAACSPGQTMPGLVGL